MPNGHILIVDDHSDTLEVLSRLLRTMGYQVRSALSAREALDCASNEKFDLLISDLTLPDGNGADLAKQICTDRAIPAVALSGYNPGDETNPASSQFAARLVKPVDFKVLQETVRKLLPD